MTIHRNVYPIQGGFVVDIVSDTTITDTVFLSPYELSRNGIKAEMAVCVKHEGGCIITSDTDSLTIPNGYAGVYPINVGRSGLRIYAYFAAGIQSKFVFYYDDIGHVAYSMAGG